MDRFDHVEVPDQWDEIVARSEGISISDDPEQNGRGWMLAVAALAVALIAGVAVYSQIDDADEVVTGTVPDSSPDTVTPPSLAPVVPPATTNPPTSLTPATSAPPTTASAVPATIATLPSTSVANGQVGPVTCTEVAGDPGRTYPSDPSLARFGPIGGRPSLELTALPSDDLPPIIDVAAIPGGVLVQARSTDESAEGGEPSAGWMLAAFDRDGTLRWRRCVGGSDAGGLWVAPAALSPTIGFAALGSLESDVWQRSVRAFDLVTGGDTPVSSSLEGMAEIDRTERHVLFAITDRQVDPGSDTLQVLDLVTGDVAGVEYAGPADDPFRYQLDDPVIEDETATVVHLDAAGFSGVAQAVNVGDGWLDDPDSILEHTSIEVRETYGTPGQLGAVDALGNSLWSIPDFASVPGEGYRTGRSGDVIVANRCLVPSDPSACYDVGNGALVGIDAATGRELWQLPGFRSVPALGDGYALISNGPETVEGYVLIDSDTGRQAVDAPGTVQEWTGVDTFATPCCGDGSFIYVKRDGGVVLAVNNEHVRVWNPAASSDDTVSVPVLG